MGRIKKLYVSKLFSDEEIASREGTWFSESDIKLPVIKSNIDVYYKDEEGNDRLLLKYRKNQITPQHVQKGWDSYKDLAKASRGRGASAGPIDTKSQYWSKRTIVNTGKWSTGYLTPEGNLMKDELDLLSKTELKNKATEKGIKCENKEKKELSKEELIFAIIKKDEGISKMKVNNQVASNPIGFYESGKNFATLPCRLTHFTRTNYEKYNEGLPFIQSINRHFKKLVPDSYEKQLTRANTKPHLKIPKTCFSTVTINRNFRTALHRDAGDFKEGFGNLTVIRRGKFHGGYTMFPQFGIGVDLDTHDFLAMDVHQWHCNSEIYETDEDKAFNETLDPAFKDNPDVGTAGLYEKYTRLTFVCYLREKIAKCPELQEIDARFLTKSGHSKIKD
jgi:hypothetical protein